MDATQSSLLGPKRSFDRDWKEIRQRLERKIAAAAAQAISARPGGGGSGGDNIRRPRWPLTPPKAKGSRVYEVKLEDKLKGRGANPRTGVVSPSNRTDSSHEDHAPRPRVSQKWKVNGNQWISVDISQSPSLASSASPDYKLTKAVSSASSGTTDISSGSWGDRFVVHMPSAKEPNPPSMSDEEIRMYQENRGKMYGNRDKRHEMDASKPKPTSEHRNTPHPRNASDAALQSGQKITRETNSVRSNGSQGYYSPDEVGRTRNSPLSDEPKVKQKELYHKLRAECFMGCVGMDQVGAKNPDEVLLFPNLDDEDEECRSSQPPAPKSRDTGAGNIKQQSKPPAAQTSRLPQMANSRPPYPRHKMTNNQLTTSRPEALKIPPALTAAYSTTKIPKPASGKGSPVGNPTRKDEEDIFISASSVARVAPKPLTRSTIQASRTRRTPDGSSRPNKGSALRHNVTTPENDLSFTHPSSVSSPSSIPPGKDSPCSRSDSVSPDFDGSISQTRQNSTATSNDSPISLPFSDDSTKLSSNDIFKRIPGAGSPHHEIHSPAGARTRNELLVKNQRAAPKTPSVAELDGFQVPQQLPSPPLSTSPSPPRAPSKSRDGAKRPGDKRGTHTIRVEIRMKAEKARQGAEEAKAVSSRLTAARQHAERLAEARIAYDRVKAQSAAKGVRSPMDELLEQRLNTERINEARKAYKAARAKEEMEKKNPEPKAREPEAKPKITPIVSTATPPSTAPPPSTATPSSTAIPSSSATPSSSTNAPRHKYSGEAKAARKPRKCGAKRQSLSQNENTNTASEPVQDDEKETTVRKVNISPAPDISLSFGVVYLSLINLYEFVHRQRVYSDVLFYSQKLPHMAAQCFKVCKCLAEAYVEYNQTGELPKYCTEDIGQFARDIGQALVNFAILGMVFIVIARAAGYIVLLASWILWFCRPFGWFFGRLIGR
ncbi:hypothetical protein PISL3812_03868 [Talaromyces islandicus]|uniref:Uncharacterized protein n=1 Tax=Talaromyces islandicus TaxID=28573 RepID=A0A0U1LVN2_TALIS|nr:hypothetical protein PISL3812_03868 [Talaromyces islandicus]